MPTYKYECSNCGHEIEIFQSMTDKKIKKCSDCGKNTLDRLIGTGGGIIFKGSGFYATDYKKNESPSKATPKKDSESCNSCKNAPVCHANSH